MRGASAERALRALGVGPGRRVALLVEPEPAGVRVLLAAGRTGAVISPLNPRWTAAESERVLEIFRPDTVLVGEELESPGSGSWTVFGVGRLERNASPPGPAGGGPIPASPTWVVWTSGTTGAPRGVVLGHEAFVAQGRASAPRLGLGRQDRWIASLSPAHVGGLALLLRAERLGSGIVAPGRFDVETFSALVDRGEATHASLVPTQLLHLLEFRRDRPFPPTFRTLLLGGAPAGSALLERALAARIPVALTWGMTETGSQAATAPPALVREKPGTVGPPMDGMEVGVDPEDGELRVRGPTLARGVFPGPEVPLLPLTDPDGWFHTGDRGRFDEDGHLWITGRLSERIITGGVTVEPGEVEAVLLEHPSVREAAVVGVPDPRWGEAIVAVVVPEKRADPPTPEALMAHLSPRLSRAKLPRRLRIVFALPRTATGKIDRARLRRRSLDPG